MSVFEKRILDLAKEVLAKARTRGWKIATAESCTGGLVAAALTEIPGSSDVVDRGFVTYSNEAKLELLGVPLELITKHGAVSVEVALAMAHGATKRASVRLGVGITGIAGPGGGTPTKPVGLVYIAVSQYVPASGLADLDLGGASALEYRFGDIGRDAVRMESVEAALNQLLLVL